MKRIYLTLVVGIFLFPSILISQTVSISGQVTRHNGDPVPDIEVDCDGIVVTDMDGNFEFTDVALNYMCNLTPTGTFDKYEEVTVLDAILVQEYIIDGNSTIDGYQFWALDVNNTQSITTLDMVKVIELALRINNNNIQNNWIFIEADYVFSNPFVFPLGYIEVNATDTITDADFITIKRGDPAISSDYMPAPTNAPSPIFTISNEAFQVGDDVQFEVTVEDFSNILGFQQTFKWDPSVLEFQSTAGASGINVNVNDGEIAQGLLPTLALMNLDAVEDGEAVMTITFKALVDVPNPTEILSFTDEITARQVVWENPVNNDLFIVEGEYLNGEGTTSIVNAPSWMESFEVFPNPTENKIYVKALFQSEGDYEILIVNLLGQKVYAEKFAQKELYLNIGFEEFPAGTYFLSLKAADGIQTESFVKK